MAALNDISHAYGNDLGVSPTGDLATVSAAQKSQQRVLRRLLTPRGSYQSHPGYGGGIGGYVGTLIDIPAMQAAILAQMLQEASVSPTPPPQVSVMPIAQGAQVSISYTVAPDQIPTTLSFQVPE